jgi:hypothetical protein
MPALDRCYYPLERAAYAVRALRTGLGIARDEPRQAHLRHSVNNPPLPEPGRAAGAPQPLRSAQPLEAVAPPSSKDDDVGRPQSAHKAGSQGPATSLRLPFPQVTAMFQQRHAFDVRGHREGADGVERERDPLPTAARNRGNWSLTCRFSAFDTRRVGTSLRPSAIQRAPKARPRTSRLRGSQPTAESAHRNAPVRVDLRHPIPGSLRPAARCLETAAATTGAASVGRLTSVGLTGFETATPCPWTHLGVVSATIAQLSCDLHVCRPNMPLLLRPWDGV